MNGNGLFGGNNDSSIVLDSIAKAAGLVAVAGLVAFCVGYAHLVGLLSGVGAFWALSLMTPVQIAMSSGVTLMVWLLLLPLMFLRVVDEFFPRTSLRPVFFTLLIISIALGIYAESHPSMSFALFYSMLLLNLSVISGIRVLVIVCRDGGSNKSRLFWTATVFITLLGAPLMMGLVDSDLIQNPGYNQVALVSLDGNNSYSWVLISPVGDRLLVGVPGKSGKISVFRIVSPDRVLMMHSRVVMF